ncbi:MAG: hypothetical protein ACR2N6_01825 [Miltoncostaeaceae bacterium]
MSTAAGPMSPEPLEGLITRLADAPLALVGLGIPRCPASELLAASLPAVEASRPGLSVGFALMEGDDWSLRETLLWPRGIRVSRSSVPALSLLRGGSARAHRPGGGPAERIDSWLREVLGPPELPLEPGLTARERAALAEDPRRRAQHVAVKNPDRRGPPRA